MAKPVAVPLQFRLRRGNGKNPFRPTSEVKLKVQRDGESWNQAKPVLEAGETPKE